MNLSIVISPPEGHLAMRRTLASGRLRSSISQIAFTPVTIMSRWMQLCDPSKRMFSRLSKDLLFRSPTYIDHGGKLLTVSPTVVAPTTLKGHYSADMNWLKSRISRRTKCLTVFGKLLHVCVLRSRTIIVGVVGLLCSFHHFSR